MAKQLMLKVMEESARRQMYQVFKESEKYLVGSNNVRCFLATKFVHEWFQLPFSKLCIQNTDFKTF